MQNNTPPTIHMDRVPDSRQWQDVRHAINRIDYYTSTWLASYYHFMAFRYEAYHHTVPPESFLNWVYSRDLSTDEGRAWVLTFGVKPVDQKMIVRQLENAVDDHGEEAGQGEESNVIHLPCPISPEMADNFHWGFEIMGTPPPSALRILMGYTYFWKTAYGYYYLEIVNQS